MANLKRIKAFFESYEHSGEPIKINEAETVVDLDKFLESMYAVLEANSGNSKMMPYFNRLLKVYKIISNGKKSETN